MEWKQECDLLLLQEIVAREPFKFKSSTRERGKVREEITQRLNENVFGNRLGSKRAVRDKYSVLAKKYRKKMTEEGKASGISPELTETDKLLEQIIEMFEESDREGGENSQQVEQSKENEMEKAEEMWNLSMLGVTLKRRAADDGQVIHKKRGSGTEILLYLRYKAEKQFELRKEELEVRKVEQCQQMQMFQAMQQQLQQQQQQQMQVNIQQQLLQNQMLLPLIEKITI